MRLALLSLLLLANACGARTPAAPSADDMARAVAAAPADPRLASLYAAACKTCHTNADSGAPLTLYLSAWDARWAKGEDVLLTHTVAGYNGMPAGGQCFGCSADDYRALIQFMAGRED